MNAPLLGDTPESRERTERDLDAEFEAHIQHRIDDLVADGATPEEARERAEQEFGDAQRIRSASLAVRERARRQEARSSRLEAVFQDLRYAARQLRHRPGFAFTALATLMLGVGATVTIASVVKSVVFEPLPFGEPDRLVMVGMLTPERADFPLSELVFLTLREDTRSFSGMTAWYGEGATLQSPGQPRTIPLARVSSHFLETLGLQPHIGRSFRPEEDAPGQPAPVAMLAHDAWTSDFGADPSVIGTTIQLDGDTYEVIGVLPEAVEVLLGDSPIATLIGTDPTRDADDHYLEVAGRLAPGTTAEVAGEEVAAVHERYSTTSGRAAGWTTKVSSPRDEVIGPTVERAGYILLGAAALLLAMACANVANLLIVRATARRTEIGLRLAIGASRARLARQLFTESGLLAAAGGGLGIVFALVAVPLVRTLGEARIPRLDQATMDGGALLIGLGAVAVATVLCGIAPALQLGEGRLGKSIASGRRGNTGSQQRLRSALAGGQVALTVVLLAGTGLLFRSFLALTSVDPGFEPEGTLAFTVNMPDQSWGWEDRAVLVPQLVEALEGLPGVSAVGASAVEPFSGYALANFAAPEDDMPDRAADFLPIQWRPVTPGFFEAMGMEMVTGRDFRSGDGDDGPIIIGRSLAERAWGTTDVLDRVLVWGDPDGSRMRIVGVVEDLRDVRLDDEPRMIIYRPHEQIPWAAMTMVIRHEGDPAGIVGAIRPQLASVAPGLPLGEVEPLANHLGRAVAEPRFNLQVLAAFAVAGLILALVGLWGVTAFDVRRRFPEIGVRLSLGARPESVMALVMRSRFVVLFGGVVLGVVLARFAAGAMSTLLYGIEPNDPVTWAAVITIVTATSLAATWVPARAAMKVDPKDVLNTT